MGKKRAQEDSEFKANEQETIDRPIKPNQTVWITFKEREKNIESLRE